MRADAGMEAVTLVEYVTLTRGTRFEIRALRRPVDDKSLVRQYMEGLQPPQRRKLFRHVKALAERGPTWNPEKCKALSGHANLFELKQKPSRVFFFHAEPGVIVLTHGFDKRGEHTPRTQIQRAVELRAMYFEEYGSP